VKRWRQQPKIELDGEEWFVAYALLGALRFKERTLLVNSLSSSLLLLLLSTFVDRTFAGCHKYAKVYTIIYDAFQQTINFTSSYNAI